jgi:hypothetical protein
MYLLCIGGGVDPAAAGFRRNMMMKRNAHFFTLFGGKSDLTYANTDLAHDEQLFALYSAVKKGATGELIEEFKKSQFYEEAKSREDELFTRFVSLYDPISIPSELKKAVLSIYREELAAFEL